MCISYDRLQSIPNERTNSVIDRCDNDGVVCPSKLRDGLFATAGVDHIYHNPNSTSSHDASHGTAISLVQHPATKKPGTDRATGVFDHAKSSMSKKIASLPSCYPDVPQLTLPSTNIVVFNTSARLVSISDGNATDNDSDWEEDWLENTREVLNETELTKEDIVSWVLLIVTIMSSAASFKIVAADFYRERSLPWHDCTCHQYHQLSH